MTWVQANQSDKDFQEHILSNSYVSDTDFLLAYFDRNNEFNITSMLTELKEKETFFSSIKLIVGGM